MHPILCRWPDGTYLSTYGVLTALGYLTGIVWLRTQAKNMHVPVRQFYQLIGTLLVGALGGGKLGFYIVERREFMADPWAMLRDWNMGWVFWSGFLLASFMGIVYQYWYNRTHRPRAYLPVADYFAAALAMGHVLGRLGCWGDGCCHGRPMGLPFGSVFINPAASVPRELLGVLLYPTQLLEAFGEALAAYFLVFKVLPGIRKGKYRYGTAFIGYFFYYSALRFVLEYFRGDDRGTLGSPVLSPSQWVSLAAGLAAACALKMRGIAEHHPAKRSIYADGKP